MNEGCYLTHVAGEVWLPSGGGCQDCYQTDQGQNNPGRFTLFPGTAAMQESVQHVTCYLQKITSDSAFRGEKCV